MTAPRCTIDAGRLRIDWADRSIELDGGLLRRHCRCAECRGLQLRETKIAATPDTTVCAALPMGYGVQLRFSDGHERGVFPWSYLLDLARGQSTGKALFCPHISTLHPGSDLAMLHAIAAVQFRPV